MKDTGVEPTQSADKHWGTPPRNESKLRRHRVRSPHINSSTMCTDADPATFQSGKDSAVGLNVDVCHKTFKRAGFPATAFPRRPMGVAGVMTCLDMVTWHLNDML